MEIQVRRYLQVALFIPSFLCWSVHSFHINSLVRVARGRSGVNPDWAMHPSPRLSSSSSCESSESESTANKSSSPVNNNNNNIGMSLPEFLHGYQDDDMISHDLIHTLCAAASACVDISQQLARLPITAAASVNVDTKINVQGEEQKPMDVIANSIFVKHVKPHVAFMASEEEEDIILGEKEQEQEQIIQNDSSSSPTPLLEIAFDPLDGSSNLDVSVPTGTIFGIASLSKNKSNNSNGPFSSSGRSLCAAGYAVYSSSVEMVISLGPSGSRSHGAHGFTLDPSLVQKLQQSYNNDDDDDDDDDDIQFLSAQCFVLTRPNMQCPEKGSYYSLNDGREPDWPNGLRTWIHDAKRGQTPSGTTYSSRYICSLCADVHRTLIKGGWAGNPRPFLRLLYEAAPLAHIVEACGGRGSDGVRDLLDIVPSKGSLHDRTCVFLGSRCDINELESYGDIQQGTKMYKS